MLAPGMFDTLTVEFTPTTWKYYYDCIKIFCEDENLLIPLHAYPIVNEVIFPTRVDVSKLKIKKIPIKCNVPIQFEFEITILKKHPDISM